MKRFKIFVFSSVRNFFFYIVKVYYKVIVIMFRVIVIEVMYRIFFLRKYI